MIKTAHMAQRPIAPQPFAPSILTSPAPIPSRNRKASYACLACKQRKSKVCPRAHIDRTLLTRRQCCQGQPCKVCQIHHSTCVYDETADQRRKVAKQRMVDEFTRQRFLLTAIIASIRNDEPAQIQPMLDMIRSNVPLGEVTAYLQSFLQGSSQMQELVQQISFGPDDFFQSTGSPTMSQTPITPSLVRERSNVGLPMNAQITLEVPQ